MAVDPVPYVVHGAKHSADVFRQALHDSTGGAVGVSAPKDMHVRQTGTPSNQVRVSPGGVLIPNSYQGGAGQSYAGRNASETLVDVPASDSTGAKSWNIIFRVQDPQFGGPEPADKESGPYSFIECVAKSANVSDPHYVLAEVEVPASTATVTNAMITDLRGLAQPREKTYMYADPTVVSTEEVLTDTTDKGELFPDVGSISPPIPEWATRVQIEAEWLQVAEPGGDFNGRIWVEWGPYVEMSKRERKTQDFAINGDGVNNFSRRSWKVAQDMFVPSALRGTKQVFFLKGRLISHSGASSRPRLDSASGIVLKLRFLQEVEQFEVNE